MKNMNGVIITKETTMKEAVASNGVLMVGRIMNRNELRQANPIVPEVKEVVVPSLNTVANTKTVVETNTVEDVSIPSFLVEHNEYVRKAKYAEFRRQELEDYIKIKKAVNQLKRDRKKQQGLLGKIKSLLK